MRKVSLALLGVAALAGLAVVAQARPADVTGSWELVIETRHGEMTSTVRFAREGDKLKVSMMGPRGRETTGEGSIKDNEIQWSVVRTTPRGQLTIVYKGTVQGGTMSGQADIGGSGNAPWKAVRQ